ncbi:MAG: FHA domain-containing protein [Deltaproteobacteria bacterium]|nr:FHA domain-containing protein [Deltaproteobacteria bacterium]
MAILQRSSGNREHRLSGRVLVGRSAACDLRLNATYVSSEHARVTWTGGAWVVRDLGSRNGTFLSGHAIAPGRDEPIPEGAEVSFGDPDERWTLSDGSPPILGATHLTSGAQVSGRDGLLALPSPDQPEVSIFAQVDGAFVCETAEGDRTPVEDGEVITVGGESYRVGLPATSEGTPIYDETAALSSVSLRFDVSSDEERVVISIRHRGRERRLESREHGYVLLTLARLRRRDEALSPAERGWVSRPELLKMLRMDSNALNVAIHRARQQLLEAGIEGSAEIVEVRRGERRLGTDAFEIVRSSDEG